ncbi:hypothetical protein EYZ11_008123 [Aspergillus tanneri]|uniref:Major facilitator superfamily (MFS) profile domain-containing protein n=1 Tax=Aspergillus tanneri TaxID=1220188 RepID=A0A4S3JB83_9EURO|nr:hypothetical protein EYZ11_008123 [Aspergillus tanneri]
MADIIRDAPIGQIIRYISNNRLLQYHEEKTDFKLPSPWAELISNPDPVVPGTVISAVPINDETNARSVPQQVIQEEKNGDQKGLEEGQQHFHSTTDNAGGNGSAAELRNMKNIKSIPTVPERTKDGAILVNWYYSDDSDDPHNWSSSKRFAVSLIICIYTFVVYTSSAIYTTSIEGVREAFGVSRLQAMLGLSLYVLGYGVGPLLFSPLGEIPSIGRSPVYAVTMVLFVIISIPTAFAGNYPGLMVLRFLQGFFGSPCLASGGASLGDMYSITAIPYAMTAWVSAAYCGPALGPLLSGFSVPVFSWRWSLYESIWVSAPVLLVMLLFLPETSGPNIMLRRAQRLRKLTGNQRFVSQSEIDQRDMKLSAVFLDALIKPLEITIKDPAVLFVQIYMAIIYGIYYSFFEAFPLVYPIHYHMNLGQVGLIFLCILIACLIAVAIYTMYLYTYITPRILKSGTGPHENRLIPALAASPGPTLGLFLFAFTSRASIHWIVPTVGITIYSATCFIIMQCLFVYIPLSYPRYAASLFAANDFFRTAGEE